MRKTLPKQKTKRDTTPKVVYLLGLLAYAAWAGWVYVLINRSPEQFADRLIFLGASFLALFLTGIFLFYQAGRTFTGKSARVVFYPAARRALFFAVFFFLIGVMKILSILNPVNAGLLGAILLLVEIQASRS